MYFDNVPGGDHPPVRTEAHIHAVYRRLFTIVSSANAAKDFTEPVTKTFQGLFAADGAVFCHIFDDSARFVAAEGTLAHMLNAELDFENPIVDKFLTDGKPCVYAREELSQECLKMAIYSRFESLILVPIIFEKFPAGLVGLASDRKGYFTAEDADTLFQLVTFMSMLITEREQNVDEQARKHFRHLGETCEKIAPELHKGTIDLIQTFSQLRKYYVSQKYNLMAEHLSNAVGNIENMAKITQSLRTLGDTCLAKVSNVERVDLKSMLDNVIDYNRTQIDEAASLEIDIDENLPAVLGEFSYIWQAVHELIQNALRAMNRSDCEEHLLKIRAYPLPNRAVIEVIDNGCGIEPCDLPHVFDPFFTKWPPAPGMGLTRARLNMLKLNGKLLCRPVAEGGMMFKIILPDEDHMPQIEIF